jgi:hypothetical protein
MLGNYRVAAQLVGSRVVLSSTELVSYLRMVSSGVLCRVALVRIDASGKSSASFIRVTRNDELGTTLVTADVLSSPILVTLMKEALRSSEASVLTRATRHNIPENTILHSRRRENLKSYIALTGWTL